MRKTTNIFEKLMKLIWFNPELDIYQKGTMEEIDQNGERNFEVIYEFKNTSEKIIDKVVAALNVARNSYSEN